MIFFGFFSSLARQGANWRECGPKKGLVLNHAAFEPDVSLERLSYA